MFEPGGASPAGEFMPREFQTIIFIAFYAQPKDPHVSRLGSIDTYIKIP